jgi:hypothetical protein
MASAKGRAAKKGSRRASRKSDPSKGSVKAGVPPTRQTGPTTATGMQLAAADDKKLIPKGKDRGSQLKIEGGEPAPSHSEAQKPRGLQKEPAMFVTNGSIEHGAVPTPSGLQPVAAVATSPEDAKKRVEKRVDEHKRFVERTVERRERLDDATVGRLGRAELRAVALQRGYEDIPEAGTRAVRAAFLREQKNDKLVK